MNFIRVLSLINSGCFSGSEDQLLLVEESIKHAKEAVMLDITDGNSWYNLGNAYLTSFFVGGAWDHTKLHHSLKAYQNAADKYLENYERALQGFEAAALNDPGLDADIEVQKIISLLDKLENAMKVKALLREAVIITLIDACLTITMEDTLDVIARKLNLDMGSLVLRHALEGRFLLFLEDAACAIGLLALASEPGACTATELLEMANNPLPHTLSVEASIDDIPNTVILASTEPMSPNSFRDVCKLQWYLLACFTAGTYEDFLQSSAHRDPELTPCMDDLGACSNTLVDTLNSAAADSLLQSVTPFSWQPAEDVVPSELASNISGVTGLVDQGWHGIVYLRRNRKLKLPTPTPTPFSPTTSFLQHITKEVQEVLPAPKPQRRRCQTTSSTQAPRRSHREAKLPQEFVQRAAATVCCTLGFTEDNQRLPAEALDKYTKFFSKPLSKDHVVALARLISKEVPSDEHFLAGSSMVCT
ncbi:hypothetical protein PR202_ga25560 [Eleusine coracana subsp. coracana]|uniref:Uncharacterized protein n=1 Tax=Eleusine coracana subsp. coracana TaxID=191504 RepID=A0AAV5DBN4_ELECO|nr:hypothetical protein PR202_ga25560 [Eleusine coracana subsp. coracana]